MHSDVEVSPKRYRYTGKERDEENGLYYHGARYYAAWLGRWVSTDPAGMVDGPNLYLYVASNPIRLHDPSGTNWVQGEPLKNPPESEVGLPSWPYRNLIDFKLKNPDLKETATIGPPNPYAIPLKDAPTAENFTATLQAQRNSVLGGAFLLIAQSRGLSLSQQRAAAELGANIEALGGTFARLAIERVRIKNIGEAQILQQNLDKVVEAGVPTSVPLPPREQTASLSDKSLVQQAEQLHRGLIVTQFSIKGTAPTEAQIGRNKGFGTVSIVQTEINGQTTRIVTANNPTLYNLLKQAPELLPEGATLGSPPIRIAGQYVHAEQIGVQDAIALGARGGTVATSNLGCKDLCVSILKEFFPTFRHLNPKQ